MPDEQAVPVETPIESPAPPSADETLSLSDHEAKYGESRHEAQTESRTPPAETPVTEPDATESASAEAEERDEKGRFKPKKHRAASQEATPADVPRIRELTARLRATEAERDALKARNSPSQTPSTPSSAPSSPHLTASAATPKPNLNEYLEREQDFVVAQAKWTEDFLEWKDEQTATKRQESERQRVAQDEQTRLVTSWESRKTAARAKYPDFDDIALAPTAIPQGSLIDAWILEHKTGADVLYHLQKHPDELDTLLSQPLFEQAEGLALLSQRLNGSSLRPAAGSTGSAPTPVVIPPPKPPNPVRTGALRAGDDPPADDASLLDHETYYQPRSRRRA